MKGELRCDFREHHFNKNATRLDQQGLELDMKFEKLRQSWEEQSGEIRSLGTPSNLKKGQNLGVSNIGFFFLVTM